MKKHWSIVWLPLPFGLATTAGPSPAACELRIITSPLGRFCLACIAAACLLTPRAVSATITAIPLPNGYSMGQGVGINAGGQVAVTLGLTGSGYPTTAFYSDGALSDIGAGNVMSNGNSLSFGLNDTGSQVATFLKNSGAATAVLISPTGVTTNLKNVNTNGSSDGSWATGINNAGTIVGSSYTASNRAEEPVMWNATGTTVTPLSTVTNGTYGSAYGINATGEIVGTEDATNGALTTGHAFYYLNGTVTAISGLTGYSDAYAVNNAGEIAGAETINGNLIAYLDDGGNIMNLGTLGGDASVAEGINSAGMVVGNADIATGTTDAFLYSSGTMIDLNTLLPANSGWTLQYAYGINDSEQITGEGLYNGAEQAYVLDLETPTPEPGSLSLCGMGLAIAACHRIRKRRA